LFGIASGLAGKKEVGILFYEIYKLCFFKPTGMKLLVARGTGTRS
jgi:hypothetical protein